MEKPKWKMPKTYMQMKHEIKSYRYVYIFDRIAYMMYLKFGKKISTLPLCMSFGCNSVALMWMGQTFRWSQLVFWFKCEWVMWLLWYYEYVLNQMLDSIVSKIFHTKLKYIELIPHAIFLEHMTTELIERQ